MKGKTVLKHGRSGASHESLQEYNPRLPAIVLVSFFNLILIGYKTTPEEVFGTPRTFIKELSMHRVGTSYHLPTGGVVYFDTGALEVVTPMIEIDKECPERAVRSLWEGINKILEGLDDWEAESNNTTRLEGFSIHYNISFDPQITVSDNNKTIEKLALLLTYILPIPTMVLSANRESSGVGVRPRGNRVEVTVDFVHNPSLICATAGFITGVVREVMMWSSYELDMLEKHGIPVVADFVPAKSSTRIGWAARTDSYGEESLTRNIDECSWEVTNAGSKHSLREIAHEIHELFSESIEEVSSSSSFSLISNIFAGHEKSLLSLDNRPKEYEDVGRFFKCSDINEKDELSRSKYEEIFKNAVMKRELNIEDETYVPIATKGWGNVVFFRKSDSAEVVFDIDFLANQSDCWSMSTFTEVHHANLR